MNIQLLSWDHTMAQDLIRVCSNVDRAYLSNRLPEPYTQKDADWYLNMISQHDGVDGLWRAISVDGKICGSISIEKKEDVYGADCEIGYMLLDACKGKGIMTEAVSRMCLLAFEKLDIIRITGLAYSPNAASRRVLEKNGFQLEGLLKNAVCKNGNIYDLVFYGKLK